MFVEESTNTETQGASYDDLANLGMDNPDGLNFGEQESETSEGSSPETNKAETNPSQEGEKAESEEPKEQSEGEEDKANTPDVKKEVPLNKDKRFQEKLAEIRQLKERESRMADQMEKMAQVLEKLSSQETKTNSQQSIPDIFLRAYGTGDPQRDAQAWSVFQEMNEYQQQQIIAKVEEMLSTKQAQEKQWEKMLDEQAEAFKQAGYEISKEELVNYLREFEPSNGLKEYDFNKVVKIHQKDKTIAELQAQIEQLKKQGMKEEKKNIAKQISGDSSNPKPDGGFTLDNFPKMKALLGK